MRVRPTWFGLGVTLVLAAAGNASSKPEIDRPLGDLPVLRGRGASTGESIALADFAGKTVALVADEDDNAVRVFELSPPREVAVAKVPGSPSQLVVLKSGKVLVALRDKGQVAILDPKGGDAKLLLQKGSIDTGGEPVALAVSPDESTLVVSSGFTHHVTAWSLADRTQKLDVDVAREPRSIAVSSDGGRAFVTHAVGATLSIVDLSQGTATSITTTATGAATSGLTGTRTRVGTQGFAMASHDGKIYVPTVMADPTAPETYYGAGLETLAVLVVDEMTAKVVPASQQFGSTVTAYPTSLERCILPRAAAVTKDGGKLYVGCAGDTELPVLDATSLTPTGKRVGSKVVGDSPQAIAIDDGAKLLVTWSQMGRQLTVAGIGDKPTPAVTVNASAAPALDAKVARGRRLFHAVDGRVAADGRACASCHTDGRDDGLTWNTPEGNRQTPMLAARLADTAPYGWTRDAKTFHEYVTGTISRLRGKGFSKDELDDLQAYVFSLKAPPKEQKLDEKLVKHGAEVFASAACISCHTGAQTSDGKKHDIADNNGSGRATPYQTPSLRFVGGTAPYFHDGRYPTLRALLTSADPNMGKAKDLPAGDIDALEAYLKSL